MLPDFAKELTGAHTKNTHLVVSWQTLSWAKRPFGEFRKTFQSGLATNPPPEGLLRELEHVTPREPMPHDAMVGVTLGKWLPVLLPKASP
jgi:hypothetical protein